MSESQGVPSREPAADSFIEPTTSGLDFIADHMREPGPPPRPSKAALEAIRRVGGQLLAGHGDTPSVTQETSHPSADK